LRTALSDRNGGSAGVFNSLRNLAKLNPLHQLKPFPMNFVPFIPCLQPARTFGSQAKPVNSSLCVSQTGAGLIARTVRGGLALLLCAGALAVCSTGLRGESSPISTIHLSSTLVSPVDVVLTWSDTSPVATSHTIEYATNPNGPYIALSFCPPSQTAFKHPNLMPQTTFYYRVRPICGPATDPVEVTLPGQLSDDAYKNAYNLPEDYSWSGPKTLPENALIVKKSLRDAATVAEAAPTDMKATFVRSTVSGLQLTWTIHSSDEDGFLLETKTEGSPEFTVCALIPPKINAFGWALRPPERKASFRIRAFYYGTPSNVETQTTVLPSAWKNPASPSQPGN
jgi:hypothetical protein